jgi:hypothetical protein
MAPAAEGGKGKMQHTVYLPLLLVRFLGQARADHERLYYIVCIRNTHIAIEVYTHNNRTDIQYDSLHMFVSINTTI